MNSSRAHQQSCLHAAMGVSTSTSELWSELPRLIFSLGKEAKRLKSTDCPASSTASTRQKPSPRTSRNHQHTVPVPEMELRPILSTPTIENGRGSSLFLPDNGLRHRDWRVHGRDAARKDNRTYPIRERKKVTHTYRIRTQLLKHTISYKLHADCPPPVLTLTRRKPT
jgi:hypothetical protein